MTTHETEVNEYAHCAFVRCSCGWFKWSKFGRKAAETLARKHVESRVGVVENETRGE